MNDKHDELPERPEESLADAMPDPAAAPRPLKIEDPALRAIGIAGVALVTVGGLLLPFSMATTSTAGATRSAKIKWEERQAELRQAAAKEEASTDRPERQEQGSCDRDGN
jgi:hypothetical protein